MSDYLKQVFQILVDFQSFCFLGRVLTLFFQAMDSQFQDDILLIGCKHT